MQLQDKSYAILITGFPLSSKTRHGRTRYENSVHRPFVYLQLSSESILNWNEYYVAMKLNSHNT